VEFFRELAHNSFHGRQFPSEVHGKQILVRRSWLRLKQSIWFRRSAAGRGGIDLRGYLFQKPVEAISIRIALELLREARRARKECVVADGFHRWQAQRLITAIP